MHTPVAARGALRVDLIILLTCFSMLAVVAVPRHLAMSSETRLADASNLAHSVESAVYLSRALWDAEDRPASLNGKWGTVDIINGYPSPATVDRLLEPAETMNFVFEAGRWRHMETIRRSCGVTYRVPESPDDPPLIDVQFRDC